jgi:predicted DNA-binding protein with PD1-like motif
MLLVEARRTRNLIVRLDRGEELAQVLQRTLDQAEARAAWITGVGSVEAAELAVFDQTRRDNRTRRVDTPCEVVSLTGNISLLEGTSFLRLSATLARETDAGLQVLAGQLLWARAFALELHVVAFDDVSLARLPDDRTGLALLGMRGGPALDPSASLARGPDVTPRPSPVQQPGIVDSPPVMARPMRHQAEQHEAYPETGDRVNHFHFGVCVVIGSDGDKIRLRQERDGRVREVALTMLRIDAPTTGDDGTRLFELRRKN